MSEIGLNPLLFRNEEEFNQYKEASKLDPTLLTTEKQNEFYKKRRDLEWRMKISIANKGRKLSEEIKKKQWPEKRRKEMAERTSKRLKGIPTNRTPKKSTSGIYGIRKDLNQYFRSTWEANFARILNHLKIKWTYEPTRFTFEHFSYLPDFYLPETDSYIEITSFLTKLKTDKILAAAKIIKLQIINKTIYNQLEKEYKDKLLNWENGVRKLNEQETGKCLYCGTDIKFAYNNQRFCGHSCLIAFRKKNREAIFWDNYSKNIIKKDRDYIITPPLVTYTKKPCFNHKIQ